MGNECGRKVEAQQVSWDASHFTQMSLRKASCFGHPHVLNCERKTRSAKKHWSSQDNKNLLCQIKSPHWYRHEFWMFWLVGFKRPQKISNHYWQRESYTMKQPKRWTLFKLATMLHFCWRFLQLCTCRHCRTWSLLAKCCSVGTLCTHPNILRWRNWWGTRGSVCHCQSWGCEVHAVAGPTCPHFAFRKTHWQEIEKETSDQLKASKSHIKVFKNTGHVWSKVTTDSLTLKQKNTGLEQAGFQPGKQSQSSFGANVSGRTCIEVLTRSKPVEETGCHSTTFGTRACKQLTQIISK